MKQVVIGIDTSCYTTSLGAVDLAGNIVVHQRLLLPVPQGEGGLRQSDGVFAHIKQLPSLYEKAAPLLSNYSIGAVCVSQSPTQEEGSYMPVFLVGKTLAQGLALGAKAPCFFTNHQAGHVQAAKIGTPIGDDPFITLHLSGGTTDVLLCKGESIEKMGGSVDLHAGQLVDRVGVALGLGFPAGKELEQIALQGQSQSLLPVSLSRQRLDCHLCGAEAQAFRWLQNQSLLKEDVAAEIYHFLMRTVARLIIAHCQRWQVEEVLLAGGVASSSLFKKLLTAYMQKRAGKIQLYFADPQLAGDNAVGVAMIGRNKLCQQKNINGGA